MGVLPAHILVHVATPVSYVEDGAAMEWLEGEPGTAGIVPTQGTPFACVLFLPGPGGAGADVHRPKVIKTPTLLYNPIRDLSKPGVPADHTPIVVTDEMELLISAPELAQWMGGTSPARWLANGDGQPFGPPGKVYGVQASLQMVEN